MSNQMYIFENVLNDYSAGFAVIIADSMEDAHLMAEGAFEISVKNRHESKKRGMVFSQSVPTCY